uniref:Integrase catalytic domain-containing protein n=1 Tax=Strigamia maritima TaxID=126957 RepID=T1IYK2_STRMM
MDTDGHVILMAKGHGGLFGFQASIIHRDTSTDPNRAAVVASEDHGNGPLNHKSIRLWHRRFTHLNYKSLTDMIKRQSVRGLPSKYVGAPDICSSCEQGKMTRLPFPMVIQSQSSAPLQLFHMDLCGPMPVESLAKSLYILTIVDNFSRAIFPRFLRSKDQTIDVVTQDVKFDESKLGEQLLKITTQSTIDLMNDIAVVYMDNHPAATTFQPLLPERQVERRYPVRSRRKVQTYQAADWRVHQATRIQQERIRAATDTEDVQWDAVMDGMDEQYLEPQNYQQAMDTPQANQWDETDLSQFVT